jgi:hypothetical protein
MEQTNTSQKEPNITYNQMMDDSKNTEEVDISRNELETTSGADSLRKLSKKGA